MVSDALYKLGLWAIDTQTKVLQSRVTNFVTSEIFVERWLLISKSYVDAYNIIMQVLHEYSTKSHPVQISSGNSITYLCSRTELASSLSCITILYYYNKLVTSFSVAVAV